MPGGGRCTVGIIGMRCEPVPGEAGVTLEHPGMCRMFCRGSCSWISGPWQCCAALVPCGGVDSDLCLHRGFLVAAAAALAFHARQS